MRNSPVGFHVLTIMTLLVLGAVRTASADVQVTRDKAMELYAKLPTDDPWEKTKDASSLAWGESHTLTAIMNLYEGTGDRKLLEDVARRGDRLLGHRDDRRGVVDDSGKSRPAWSMGSKYVVASGQLVGAAGKPVVKLRSTASSNNDKTTVEVKPGENGRFTLVVTNPHFQRQETFADLSLDPSDARYVETIVDHPKAPYSPRPGTATEHSHLLRVESVEPAAGTIKAQTVTLAPIPLAYTGYLGVIYYPLMRFAEIVKGDPALAEFVPVADRFIRAAEESYADASKRLWREGPNDGEGYYLCCEKGQSFPYDNIGEPFNYLGRHAASQILLHKLTGKPEYKDRAERMARLFKNRLRYDETGDLYVWNYWYEPVTTTGWKPEDDLSYNIPHFGQAAYVEDASHGVLDVEMVAAMHEAGLVFDDTDLRRFANTLLKNVLLPDRTGVRRRVDGEGGEHKKYFLASHGWLVLSGRNPQVYHDMRTTYENRGDDDFRWLAHLLKWERKLGGPTTIRAFPF